MSERVIAGVPAHAVDLPADLRAVAGEAVTTLVWQNDLGGLTYRVGDDRYMKWAPCGSGLPPLMDEVYRLRWAADLVPVPVVLGYGSTPTGDWMLTAALRGESAVTPRWQADPSTAARAIGTGLRRLHDALPIADCPFDWSVERRLRNKGISNYPPPPVDRLVVCHGDACAPNTLLWNDGSFLGHVDLGSLGVADRWADLSVATYSLDWNYGEGYEDVLLDAYGIAQDPMRTAYYRALWDAT